MYRTNTDLEESILRISGWVFYEVQNEIQWCSGSQRSVYPVPRVDPFFSARSFHAFWAGSAFSSQKIPLFAVHPLVSQ